MKLKQWVLIVVVVIILLIFPTEHSVNSDKMLDCNRTLEGGQSLHMVFDDNGTKGYLTEVNINSTGDVSVKIVTQELDTHTHYTNVVTWYNLTTKIHTRWRLSRYASDKIITYNVSVTNPNPDPIVMKGYVKASLSEDQIKKQWLPWWMP